MNRKLKQLGVNRVMVDSIVVSGALLIAVAGFTGRQITWLLVGG